MGKSGEVLRGVTLAAGLIVSGTAEGEAKNLGQIEGDSADAAQEEAQRKKDDDARIQNEQRQREENQASESGDDN